LFVLLPGDSLRLRLETFRLALEPLGARAELGGGGAALGGAFVDERQSRGRDRRDRRRGF
jgi:hypothetical protein